MNPDMEPMPEPNAEWLDGFKRDEDGKPVKASDGIVPGGRRQTLYWRKDGSAAELPSGT